MKLMKINLLIMKKKKKKKIKNNDIEIGIKNSKEIFKFF